MSPILAAVYSAACYGSLCYRLMRLSAAVDAAVSCVSSGSVLLVVAAVCAADGSGCVLLFEAAVFAAY